MADEVEYETLSNTSAACFREAEKWEQIFGDTPVGDPVRRLAELNIDYFLEEAAKLEKEGK